MEFAWHGHMIW